MLSVRIGKRGGHTLLALGGGFANPLQTQGYGARDERRSYGELPRGITNAGINREYEERFFGPPLPKRRKPEAFAGRPSTITTMLEGARGEGVKLKAGDSPLAMAMRSGSLFEFEGDGDDGLGFDGHSTECGRTIAPLAVRPRMPPKPTARRP